MLQITKMYDEKKGGKEYMSMSNGNKRVGGYSEMSQARRMERLRQGVFFFFKFSILLILTFFQLTTEQFLDRGKLMSDVLGYQ